MHSKIKCAISGKEYPPDQVVPLFTLDENMLQFIQRNYPDTVVEDYIGEDLLLSLRKAYLNEMLAHEYGELNEFEKQVIDSVSGNKILSRKRDVNLEEKLSLGDKLADQIADFGGSWTFIISFFCFILLWVGFNIWWMNNTGFDPYPFILLNLILSCLAAIQAPIIMMSQNRQETKDRLRAEHDYKINLKAELEIQLLHKKIDHLLIHQSKRLLEIQRIQTEMTEAVLKKLSENGVGKG